MPIGRTVLDRLAYRDRTGEPCGSPSRPPIERTKPDAKKPQVFAVLAAIFEMPIPASVFCRGLAVNSETVFGLCQAFVFAVKPVWIIRLFKQVLQGVLRGFSPHSRCAGFWFLPCFGLVTDTRGCSAGGASSPN